MEHRKYNISDIIKKLSEYIDREEYPIIAEFAYQYPVPRQYIYEMEKNKDREDLTEEERSIYIRLSDTIKKLHDKAEVYLLKKEPNQAKAIFVLKQPAYGYTDRQEVVNDTQINIAFSIPRPALDQGETIPTVDITPKLGKKTAKSKGKKP